MPSLPGFCATGRQIPAWQSVAGGHLLLHSPQWTLLVAVSTHRCPQEVKPGWQRHLPAFLSAPIHAAEEWHSSSPLQPWPSAFPSSGPSSGPAGTTLSTTCWSCSSSADRVSKSPHAPTQLSANKDVTAYPVRACVRACVRVRTSFPLAAVRPSNGVADQPGLPTSVGQPNTKSTLAPGSSFALAQLAGQNRILVGLVLLS